MKHFLLKGDLCYNVSQTEIRFLENHYLLCLEGKSAGVFSHVPTEYQDLPLLDYSGQLIIPGLVDLHTHAPQFENLALGFDLELIDWLDTHTFPEEARFSDPDYAKAVYENFTSALCRSATTRAVIFATQHVPATIELMELLEASGMSAYVGKVNMDRNSPDSLREQGAETSLRDTRLWLDEISGKFQHIKPILTPRFIPSCSDALMKGLGDLAKAFSLPLQSHLSENKKEIAWVSELAPTAKSYGHAYHMHGLFGGDVPTIMAHCIWPTDDEFQLMQEQNIWVAHCPSSNSNISSGIAPIRRYLDAGIPVGLATDISGGTSLNMFAAIKDALTLSKLYWRLIDDSAKPLTLAEAFYLATRGGGSFFGEVGSFEKGFDFDALILTETTSQHAKPQTLPQRFERAIHLHDMWEIKAKFVQGRSVDLG